MEFAWKDQNVVLFMSTVSNPQDTVTRLRRRPAKTATNARTSRAVFGEMSSQVHPAAARDHGRLERMGDKAKYCVVCLKAGRGVPKPAQIRKPLQELSTNSVRPSDLANRMRRRRAPRGIYGCKLCGIHICNHIACWNEHIAAISNR